MGPLQTLTESISVSAGYTSTRAASEAAQGRYRLEEAREHKRVTAAASVQVGQDLVDDLKGRNRQLGETLPANPVAIPGQRLKLNPP